VNYPFLRINFKSDSSDQKEGFVANWWVSRTVSDCICPECIIHGVHKDHEVKTVKKAYPIIKEKIDEINNGLETKVKNV